MNRQAHAQAVLDRLATIPQDVHDGSVPDAEQPPYVVVYFSFRHLSAEERPGQSNLVFASLPFEVTVNVHSVGGGDTPALAARSARAVANQVALALLDWTPTVAGRSCRPVRHIDEFAAPPNEQTGQAYHDLTDVYRFTSHPA